MRRSDRWLGILALVVLGACGEARDTRAASSPPEEDGLEPMVPTPRSRDAGMRSADVALADTGLAPPADARLTTTDGAMAPDAVPLSTADGSTTVSRPRWLYTLAYHAEGDPRYLPDGDYQELFRRLSVDFEVETTKARPTPAGLRDVSVLFIASPNDKAVGNGPPPGHVSADDARAILDFVRAGGGLVLLHNQDAGDHNVEIDDLNQLMMPVGLRFTRVLVPFKGLTFGAQLPLVGGQRWAFYAGCGLERFAAPGVTTSLFVENDLTQRPLRPKDTDVRSGMLAANLLGEGRVVVATDSGWATGWAFDETGVGVSATAPLIKGQDNWEIFHRLARWAAKLDAAPASPATGRPLFNGRDLSGWTGDPALWKVVDGQLAGTSAGLPHHSHLITTRPFRDFELRFRARLDEGNSGVHIRSSIEDPARHTMSGYHVDIAPKQWGRLYEIGGRNHIGTYRNVDTVASLGAWANYVVRAQGSEIVVTVNGTETTRYTETDSRGAREGYIGLQLHEGRTMKVQFSDVFIREL